MANYDLISRLHSDKTDWSVRVKVIKKWFERGLTIPDSFQFLLMDEEGEYIQAYVYLSHLIKYCDKTIHEGQWKSLTNFVVFADIKEERNTVIGFAIKICENTIILNTPPRETVNHIGFHTFGKIMAREFHIDLPTSTLGFIVAMEELTTALDERVHSRPNKRTTSLTFTLKDDKGFLLRCTALVQVAVDMNDSICIQPHMTVLCHLTDWTVKIDDGGTSYIQTRGGISRIDFHPYFPDAAAFLKRFWDSEDQGVVCPDDVLQSSIK